MEPNVQAQTSGVRLPEAKPKHHHMPLVLGAVLILILLLAGWYWWNQTQKGVTPLEQLSELKYSSRPVSESVEDRLIELEAIQESSAPVTATSDEQLNMLESLGRSE